MNTKICELSTLIQGLPTTDGDGVKMTRMIGTPELNMLDPFLLFDVFESDQAQDYIGGFPDHPHRGFETVTYLLAGRMRHKDSAGHEGVIEAGGVQWMKAGSGVIHSEMPKQENGLMRGFQLWINLPATNKMDKPEYQEYESEAFPIIETTNYSIKLLIGSIGNIKAPIVDTITHVSYFDVHVKAGKPFQYKHPAENNSFLFLFEGGCQFNGQNVPLNTLIMPGTDGYLPTFIAGKQGARLIVISGKPIKEPIIQYGPFVMSTREEIDQAIHDYQSNDFVQERAWVKNR